MDEGAVVTDVERNEPDVGIGEVSRDFAEWAPAKDSDIGDVGETLPGYLIRTHQDKDMVWEQPSQASERREVKPLGDLANVDDYRRRYATVLGRGRMVASREVIEVHTIRKVVGSPGPRRPYVVFEIRALKATTSTPLISSNSMRRVSSAMPRNPE